MQALPIRRLQRALLRWYCQHGRLLWWRQLPADPYRVLVTEVMLQQTQAKRVQAVLPEFLRRFPTLQSLAEASLAEVLRAWQGLGYNRRARLLWECARMVVNVYSGHLPSEPQQLRRLPGIGAYTAAAIATFAFGRGDVPVVDTNVRRVLQRLAGLPAASPRQIEQLARKLIPVGASAEWHQGLMDIGALYCHPRQPRCMECPLQRWCRYAGRCDREKARRQRRQEPCFDGVPRRLWRGRLLRIVAAAGELSVEEAACRLFGAQPTVQQRRWFEELVELLCRDGLLCFSDSQLSLPK